MKTKNIFLKICLSLTLLLCVAIILSFTLNPFTTFAGIGFTNPIYGLSLIDKDANLSVCSENLTIVPPNILSNDRDAVNMPNKLNTHYEILNGGAAKTARIALPVTESLSSDFLAYSLTADGIDITPRIYYSDLSILSYDSYVDIYSNCFADPVVFDESLSGVLYEISAPAAVEVSFSPDANQKIIHDSGFITLSAETHTTIFSPFGQLSVFSTGGLLDITCLTENAVITTSVVGYNDYLALFFKLEETPDNNLPYMIYATNIFQRFINGSNAILEFDELLPPPYGLVLLVYEVSFNAGINNIILDRPIHYGVYSNKPRRYALYFVNLPQRSWASFGVTNISITMSPDLPYVVSEGFEKTADNTYSFSGDIASTLDENYIIYSAGNPADVWRTVLTICIIAASIAFTVFAVFTVQIIRKKARHRL